MQFNIDIAHDETDPLGIIMKERVDFYFYFYRKVFMNKMDYPSEVRVELVKLRINPVRSGLSMLTAKVDIFPDPSGKTFHFRQSLFMDETEVASGQYQILAGDTCLDNFLKGYKQSHLLFNTLG